MPLRVITRRLASPFLANANILYRRIRAITYRATIINPLVQQKFKRKLATTIRSDDGIDPTVVNKPASTSAEMVSTKTATNESSVTRQALKNDSYSAIGKQILRKGQGGMIGGAFSSTVPTYKAWLGTAVDAASGAVSTYVDVQLSDNDQRCTVQREKLSALEKALNEHEQQAWVALKAAGQDFINPLLKLYSETSAEEKANQQTVIDRLTENLIKNEQLQTSLTEVRKELAQLSSSLIGKVKHGLIESMITQAQSLAEKLTLQHQQLQFARSLHHIILQRKAKDFDKALKLINALLNEKITDYQKIYEQTNHKAKLLSPSQLLQGIYNNKAKIHRGLAGLDLANLDQHQLIESEKVYRAALAIEDNAQLRNSLGFLLSDKAATAALSLDQCLALVDEALEHHAEAFKRDNTDDTAHHGMAYALYRREQCKKDAGQPVNSMQLEQALEEFDRVKPINARVYLDRGLTCLLLGDKENALKYFAKGIEFEPSHLLLRLERAKLYIDMQDYPSARKDLFTGLRYCKWDEALANRYQELITELQKYLPAAPKAGR